MTEQFEVEYNGSKLLVEAKCSKTFDKYMGANTCEVDIVSVHIIHDIDNLEEVQLDDNELDEVASIVAYMFMDVWVADGQSNPNTLH